MAGWRDEAFSMPIDILIYSYAHNTNIMNIHCTEMLYFVLDKTGIIIRCFKYVDVLFV